MQNKRKLGTFYEQIAGSYLIEKGYEIQCYNYRCYCGEIDIIARKGEELIFVEVKYRKNLSMGNPLEAVTSKKQQTIAKCAQVYMLQNKVEDTACRFDVIGIIGKIEDSDYEVIHIENAFEAYGT